MNGQGPKSRPCCSRVQQEKPFIENDPQPAKGAQSALRGTQASGLRRSARLHQRQYPLAAENPGIASPTVQRPQPPRRRDTTFPLEPKAEEKDRISPSPITLPRKRQIDSEGDEIEHQPKPARLTQKNLTLFNKMRKKMAGENASPLGFITESLTKKSISATSSGFADQVYKNGILHPRQSKAPRNLEDIHERHAMARASPSPTKSEFNRYANSVGVAPNEATMVYEVGTRLLKNYNDDSYHKVFSQAFTGFPKDVGFNNNLSYPSPDYIEGLEKQQYSPVPIDHINGAILYKDNPFPLTLPHLAGEFKGCGKDMDNARLQSAYDGASLVYARNEALSYMGKSDPPGHAEVTTFATDGTNINFYAHYAAPSDDGTPKYHQYQYASINVKDSLQGHKDGRRALRNEQDHAKKQSYTLRDEARKHWKQQRSELCSTTEGNTMPPPDVARANANDDEAD